MYLCAKIMKILLCLLLSRREFLHQCVLKDAAGCTSSLERTMLTSSQWFYEALDNVGTCEVVDRSCEPEEALRCLHRLGEMLNQHDNYKDPSPICS